MRGPSEGCTTPLTGGCGRQTWQSELQRQRHSITAHSPLLFPCYLESVQILFSIPTVVGRSVFFFFFTSASPAVLISCALTDGAEELVDLFEGQRVVQRFQWINGGHHGAAFKACSRAEGRPSPEAHQEARRNQHVRASQLYSPPPQNTPTASSCFQKHHNLLIPTICF